MDALPFDIRPLLVFVNLKSGPQKGATIKRQLMQTLHPLQVGRPSPPGRLGLGKGYRGCRGAGAQGRCWPAAQHQGLRVSGGAERFMVGLEF
jgi:hypothetical protein